jgi:hypothetical protein
LFDTVVPPTELVQQQRRMGADGGCDDHRAGPAA